MDLPFKVTAEFRGSPVWGYLTGNGSGSYTGLRLPQTGDVVAVKKTTVALKEAE